MSYTIELLKSLWNRPKTIHMLVDRIRMLSDERERLTANNITLKRDIEQLKSCLCSALHTINVLYDEAKEQNSTTIQ